MKIVILLTSEEMGACHEAEMKDETDGQTQLEAKIKRALEFAGFFLEFTDIEITLEKKNYTKRLITDQSGR